VHEAFGGAFLKRHHVDCGMIAIIYKVPILGHHITPRNIQEVQASKLGDAPRHSFFINKIPGHLSRHYIFNASYAMCFSWSVFISTSSFVLFCLLQ
jgi:hypothetical protein